MKSGAWEWVTCDSSWLDDYLKHKKDSLEKDQESDIELQFHTSNGVTAPDSLMAHPAIKQRNNLQEGRWRVESQVSRRIQALENAGGIVLRGTCRISGAAGD